MMKYAKILFAVIFLTLHDDHHIHGFLCNTPRLLTKRSEIKLVSSLASSLLKEEQQIQESTNQIDQRNEEEQINIQNDNDIQSPMMNVLADMKQEEEEETTSAKNEEYNRGLVTIAFITILFSSNSPIIHYAFSNEAAVIPPVLLLNAAVSCIALVGLLFGGSTLESSTTLPSSLKQNDNKKQQLMAGLEMGLWKTAGTTANLYGLSLTTADHGAFLIQLTTLIVPVVQGIMGVPIPKRIQFSVVLALAGVFAFTQDGGAAGGDIVNNASALGDALCVVAAGFYATYDLRLFEWGKRISPRKLITSKIATQAILSLVLLFTLGYSETLEYVSSSGSGDWYYSFLPVALWSGIAVNAVAPFLQVGGQQAVGPTRCQTIYASQPLWASILSFFFLGETVSLQGLGGGLLFMVALFLAATADPPDADCGQSQCEV